MTREPTLRFGPYELDPVRRVLLREGLPVALSGRPMELLLTLIAHRDRVLDRGELLAAVWPDAVVEEANLTQNVSVLRKTLGEGPGDNTYILTVTGRGYRFVAPVESDVTGASGSAGPSRASRRRSAARLGAIAAGVVGLAVFAILLAIGGTGGRGSPAAAVLEPRAIAVLPFLTGQLDGPAGARGIALADAVINRLVERGLAVRPTRAVLEFADPRRDTPAEAGRALGAGIVVSGSLRELASRAQVSVQVTRAQTGDTVWAGSIDVGLGGENLEERIADAVAGRLAEIVVSVAPREASPPASE